MCFIMEIENYVDFSNYILNMFVICKNVVFFKYMFMFKRILRIFRFIFIF